MTFSLALCGLLSVGLIAPSTAGVTQTQHLTASQADYYSGLATGQGYQDYYARIYTAGTPAYLAAIESEYLKASRAREQARFDNDQQNVDFWSGFIDGLGRSAEESY